MIKKIPVDQLKPGMYVSDFNAGWLDHPFTFNSMKITGEDQVKKVFAAGIKELFIDTSKGLDASHAPTIHEAAAETRAHLEKAIEAPKPLMPERRVSLAEEMTRARSTFSDATKIVRSVMDDIRLGKQPEMEAIKPMVERITSSVVRNSNAMMTMRRMQNHDDYTFLHSVSVCTMLVTFAKAAGMEEAIHDMALGALLHDMGKMRVNMAILNKPSKLSDDEYKHMKSHVVLGQDLLRQMPGIPAMAFEPLELHHERYDGSGYPKGLKGEEISRVGRMAAIVDVYDAITSDRVYRKAMNPAAAMQRLFEWSKFHFDPALTQIFVKSVGIYPIGSLVKLESGRLGVVVEQQEEHLLTPVVRVIFDTKRECTLAAEDVNLAKPMGSGGADRIVGVEDPAKWGLEVARFMG